MEITSKEKTGITFSQYQTASRTTVAYPQSIEGIDILYPFIGGPDETGELLGKLKKLFRGDFGTPGTIDGAVIYAAVMEMGDVMWNISQMVTELGADLQEMANKAFARAKDFRKATPLAATLKLYGTMGTIADRFGDMLLYNQQFAANTTKTRADLLLLVRKSLVWLIVLANALAITMEEVMEANLKKLKYRLREGKTRGSGDNR